MKQNKVCSGMSYANLMLFKSSSGRKVIVIDPKAEYENLKHSSEKENPHMLTFGELGPAN